MNVYLFFIYIYIYIYIIMWKLISDHWFHAHHLMANCSVGWGYRIHWLHLCRGVSPSPKCPGYDIKQSDGEYPIILELWVMWSSPSLPLLPGLLRPGVVAPDKVLSFGQIEVNSTHATLNCLKKERLWHLTVGKQKKLYLR